MRLMTAIDYEAIYNDGCDHVVIKHIVENLHKNTKVML